MTDIETLTERICFRPTQDMMDLILEEHLKLRKRLQGQEKVKHTLSQTLRALVVEGLRSKGHTL